jgi:asparagine synthase (glutamine-hydrolysing)
MKLGVLFSGGKDSTFATELADYGQNEVVCLMSMKSENKDSYMFHTPNIDLTELQAKSLNLPLISSKTEGKKEAELIDLRRLIQKAQKEYGIEGVVTGAVESVYQASRIQKICSDLKLWCFNPLWQLDQEELLNQLIKRGYEIIISGIAAYPMDEKWLGRKLTKTMIEELVELREKFGVNPAGEGGEFESLVLNGPNFKKRIQINKYKIQYKNHAGVFSVEDAELK